MKNAGEIIQAAINTLHAEAKAVNKLVDFVNADFVAVVQHIYASPGRVIVTGIGKSAIIANKIVATLNSTGTPAIFMHAADAIHGDLGIIQQNDTVICISKSGNTPEIKILVPLLKQSNNKLVAFVGNTNSYLALHSDFIVNCFVEKEACPNDLAPTSSSTAQMAMGDALAICLLECRDFSATDFARFHPGGTLGKKLYLRVSDIYTDNEKPCVQHNDDIKKTIIEISSRRLGATAVLNNKTLVGIVTDGDIRRMLEKHNDISKLTANDIMSVNPKTIEPGELAVNAVRLMQQHSITQLIVAEGDDYKGLIHMHNLIKEGLI